MANRSVAYVNDGSTGITVVYSKFDYANTVWFDNTKVTALAVAAYDAATGGAVTTPGSAAWDSALQGWKYTWPMANAQAAYAAGTRRVRFVLTPTRATGVAVAWTPPVNEDIDLADTNKRIDIDTAAVQTAIITEVDAKAAEMEGTGFTSADTLHQAKLQRDSIAAQVSALDIGQSTNFIVPSFMAQSKTYAVHLRIKDDGGNLVDADSTPTNALLEGPITGVTVGAFTRVAQGRYDGTVAIDAAVAAKTAFTLLASWDRTEGAIVNHEDAPRGVIVDSFESDTSQILTIVTDIQSHANNPTYGFAALQVIMADVQSKVNDGTFGLSALKTAINAVAAQVGTGSADLHTKLGAFNATLNLFAMLGAFTNVETVFLGVQKIQGQLPV